MNRTSLSRSELPLYARATYVLAGFALLLAFLYFAKDLLVPLVYAGLLAVLLHPVSNFLERHKVPGGLASFLAVMAASLVIAGIAAFIAMQIGQFGEELPHIKEQSRASVERFQSFIKESLGITYRDQLRWFQQWWSQTWQSGGAALAQTLLTFMDITTLVTLVPLYAFLMLFYKDHLIVFLYQVVDDADRPALHDILDAARSVVKGYVIGLIIETAIVATLDSIALLLLGIPYAILFGILAGILNLIPYIGGIVAILLPLTMAFISTDSLLYPAGVAVAFILIQLIDNNILVPYVVASRISINALISVIAVIIGGMLWGISGMFLSLPTVAILKIIFDRVEGLKPWGHLLGQGDLQTPRGRRSARK